ncbi:NACHT domain-containing protein [Iningainema tapete]|uniref:NACHT domain-containing protein n=1 Tax=Iningainema tapete BLCC-T55 TaxID=2748662 RepID=A0A8J6XDE5_9CYAN|nr:NACHT domain-containing protein [Iningainema tapete]MBD2771293.1 NACHT domain-containing protein [Iningainema tapete BLCC-T55]
MAKRSLVASVAGINRARLALERQNLTQKALQHQLGIAWATVNKFFNGKPVERYIFTEICQSLNLDWQEIVSPLIPESAESESKEEAEIPLSQSSDLLNIHSNAQRARTALDPYILPRIRREALLEKCLNAIRQGVYEERRRVIPILGAAGYGKSTILGTIYDELDTELVQSGKSWVALVRCNDLIEGIDTFATELGEKASGIRESIVEVTSKLSTQHGKGVLLIDTLDLVLEKKLVPVLRGILLQLLENGTTVVFTCRESDYRDFFEPYHESFAGFTESIQKCLITEFDEEEVKEAATAFCQQELGIDTPEGSTEFAQKVIALSADSKSLADITRNPLLLALMCKLFAEDGNVPEDLTVSQLYQMYWDLKIATSRKNRADSRRIGMWKQNLCLSLASVMYNSSDERLRDFVYETQLELNETQFPAYEELISDGVLQELGANRVSFFHQTFLEYAIARYFESTPTGEEAKHQVLNHLRQPQNKYSKHYIWSIFRQLLNLVNLDEFQRISNQLHKQELYPFRAIAFAAVSRTEPESSHLLLQLLPTALQLGDAYQDTLLVAAAGAPTRHAQTVWLLVLELLTQTGQTLVNKAAEIAGELLTRIQTYTENPIEQVFSAVEQRKVAPELDAKEEAVKVLGKLMSAYAKTPKTSKSRIDINVLIPLKERYFSFGSNARSIVVQLYLNPGVPDALQRELLMLIITQPITELAKEKENVIELLKHLLPSLIQSGDSPFGSSWFKALYASLAQGWDLVQAAVIGHQAANDPDLMAKLIKELFKENLSQEDSEKLRRHQIAITEAIKKGARNCVASSLITIPINTVPKNRLSTIWFLIREVAHQADESQISPELCLYLAQWILPIVSSHPTELIPVLDVLASHEPRVEVLLGEVFGQVISDVPQQKINSIVKKLKYVSSSLESYLTATSNYKESRAALVKLYQRQAENYQSESAIKSLLSFCLDDSREVALEASTILLRMAEKLLQIPITDFVPILANSKILGVRYQCLKLLIKRVELGGVMTDVDIISICTTLKNESLPEIVQPLYDLVKCWVHTNNYITNDLAELIFEITNRLVSEREGVLVNGGIAQSAFVTLKHIANLEDSRLNSQLGLCTVNLLRATDVREVNRVYVIGLLDKVAKFDSMFLSQIVREDCVTENGILPIANLYSIVVAIIYNQGKYSPLLDEILNDERLPLEVKNRIIREREG